VRSLTGLKVRQFEELHKKFDAELLSRKLLAKPKRQRALGGGRRHTLQDSAGRLFFILMYFKAYTTMAVAGFLFGLARSCICDWGHTCQPVLEAVLGKNVDLPKRQISWVDLGYKGLENEYEGITIRHKKPVSPLPTTSCPSAPKGLPCRQKRHGWKTSRAMCIKTPA
jgi:hypothetical protein